MFVSGMAQDSAPRWQLFGWPPSVDSTANRSPHPHMLPGNVGNPASIELTVRQLAVFEERMSKTCIFRLDGTPSTALCEISLNSGGVELQLRKQVTTRGPCAGWGLLSVNFCFHATRRGKRKRGTPHNASQEPTPAFSASVEVGK